MIKKFTLAIAFVLFCGITVFPQSRETHTDTYLGTHDFRNSTVTIPFHAGTTPPVSCIANVEFFLATDAVGCRILMCNASGDGWTCAAPRAHTELSDHSSYATSTHASEHQDGGSDEIAVLNSTAGGIPKAGASGTLEPGWLPTFTQSDNGIVPAPTTASGRCLLDTGWDICPSSSNLLDSRGQLQTHDGESTAVLDPGSDNQILISASQQLLGIRWATLQTTLEHIIPAASQSGASCYPGPGIYFDATTGPACSVGTASTPYAWAGLDFSGTAQKCMTFQSPVPRRWDGTAVTARVIYTKTAATFGQMYFTLATSFIGESYTTEGSSVSLSAPTFNSVTLPTTSTLASPQNANEKLTGVFSNLNMSGAEAGRLGIFKLCREGADALDTSSGVSRVYTIYLSWPVSSSAL